MKIQPLRIDSGWTVEYNQLYEIDPIAGNEDYFNASSLLMLKHSGRQCIIDVEWHPENQIPGSYFLQVLSFLETYNFKSGDLDHSVNWEEPHLEFETSSRGILVNKLEELMISLPQFPDPRFLKRRGVIDVEAEEIRKLIVEKGVDLNLAKTAFEIKNHHLHLFILDHGSKSRDIVELYLNNSPNKRLHNKAKQLINRFKP